MSNMKLKEIKPGMVVHCKNEPECEELLDEGKTISDNMCKKCLVEWLQSEVEE